MPTLEFFGRHSLLFGGLGDCPYTVGFEVFVNT
jgi:hypothetical protein